MTIRETGAKILKKIFLPFPHSEIHSQQQKQAFHEKLRNNIIYNLSTHFQHLFLTKKIYYNNTHRIGMQRV